MCLYSHHNVSQCVYEHLLSVIAFSAFNTVQVAICHGNVYHIYRCTLIIVGFIFHGFQVFTFAFATIAPYVSTDCLMFHRQNSCLLVCEYHKH